MRFHTCIWFLLVACSPPLEDVVTVDATVTYQTMRGWEAAKEVRDPCVPGFAHLRDAIIRSAVDDIGIDRVRIEVRSGVENDVPYWSDWVASGCHHGSDPAYGVWRRNRYATVNDNDDPNAIEWTGFNFEELDWHIEQIILPLKERLEAAGDSLFINMTYVAFIQQLGDGAGYHHHDPEEYAEFVLATYLHMRDRFALVPDTWEVVLEPDNGPGFDGALLGHAMVAAARRLTEHGFTPRFVAPSTKTMRAAITYFDEMIAVPGVLDYLVEYSYHRYGGVSTQNLEAIAARAQEHGLHTAMLEWWFGNATHEVLHEDLTTGRNSAWQGRVLGGLVTVDSSATPVVQPKEEVRFNRQYFRFVRRGAVRIDARSETGALDAVAFINPDGGHVVVVNADREAEFTVRGLPAGRYELNYTTEREYDVDLPAADVAPRGTLRAAIPARGVITIRAEPGGCDGARPCTPVAVEPASVR